MNGIRNKLRLFYLGLCVSQLVVMGLGLAVAYQVQRSYSRNIDYETSVNAGHRALDELEVFARAASPESLALDDNSSDPSQLSQVAYASRIFLQKAQELQNESERSPGSPLVRSQPDLRTLISQMNMVAAQSRLAGEAWAQNDSALARARLTYADRAAERVQTTLGEINQEMSRSRDELLSRENAEARRTRYFLRPLLILGILLTLPALLYARRLNRDIWAYETQLENEKNLLEERVAARTSELRDEIQSRERIESFDSSRNRLLEKVAEGKDLEEILTQLVHATERSLSQSQCLILLGGGHSRSAIAPSVSSDLAAHLETALLNCWDTISIQDAADRCATFVRGLNPHSGVTFADAWSQGFHSILAVPITEPERPLLGVIALLLRDQREPDGFAREVLLSASRMASVALKHDRMQDELFRQAHYDSLTSLPNRVLFEDRLQQAVALASRRKSHVGVLCIDLDGFKQVNDGHGHQAGDLLLQQVARRLASISRKADTTARLGGDEFATILNDARDGESIAKVSESLVRLLAEPYSIGNTIVRTTASIGAAMFPADGTSCAELRRHADLAMYRAKERGRNTYQMFSAELGERLERRKQIEGLLQEALDGEGFELFYQPIYTIAHTLVGLEALIRFRNPELKSISPAEFMPLAEQTGVIPQIGEWVLREACRQGKQWQEDGFEPVPVAVNVSAIQLARPNFAEHVAQILSETGLAPGWLHIEVTETAIMSDFEAGGRELHALAEQGVHIAVDDFGTGHSSLSYIHRLPIKTVKIDRSFVKNMVDSQESKAIVRAIIAMAQVLELTVIAEGVETQDQLVAITKAGCDAAQGYFFSRPLDSISVSRFLNRRQSRAPGMSHSIQV
jgi:diguanylate cyclase (GGDEF)-like protein